MPIIPMRSTTIYNACCLTVRAGTNGDHGGDAGHGGRTVVILEDAGNTDMRVQVDDGDLVLAEKVMLVFSGDSEREACATALRFAADAICPEDTIEIDEPSTVSGTTVGKPGTIADATTGR